MGNNTGYPEEFASKPAESNRMDLQRTKALHASGTAYCVLAAGTYLCLPSFVFQTYHSSFF